MCEGLACARSWLARGRAHAKSSDGWVAWSVVADDEAEDGAAERFGSALAELLWVDAGCR